MRICLDGVGKRFLRSWAFRGLSHCFESGGRYAVLGRNGSGKSTLLRIVAGMQAPSEGKVEYDSGPAPDRLFSLVSYCAPAMQLVEEFTLEEAIRFHTRFRPLQAGLDVPSLLRLTGLEQARARQILTFSSGMKQRVKLALSICAQSRILLLDEPCTNLDQAGIAQYEEWLRTYASGKTVLIASNDPREYALSTEAISMEDFKR